MGGDHGDGEISPSQRIDFVTMGMFIIDEIHYPAPQPSQFNILGGAGSYSALGARILSPPPLSKTCGWIIDAGSDFPSSLVPLIQSWTTSVLVRNDPSRLTTRGWNSYSSETQYRQFEYTTLKRRLEAEDLIQAPALLNSRSFHLICSPSRCISLVQNILFLRCNYLSQNDREPQKPLFIWEPVPDAMTPAELLNVTSALGFVDICSPNHAELGQLMACTGELADGSVDKDFVEEATEQLISSMPLSSVAIVVRCGAEGCYIGQNGGRTAKSQAWAPKQTPAEKSPEKKISGEGISLTENVDMFALLGGLSNRQDCKDDEDSDEDMEELENDYGLSTWIPAYHTDSAKVVDPTGGGNAFLGGMAVSFARGQDIVTAAKMGSITASFAIEQVGMPTLARNENGEETWNGVFVENRIRDFERRLDGSLGTVEDLMDGVQGMALKPVVASAN